MQAEVTPALVGDFTLPDGRRAVPVFQLLAERYLDPRYAPEAVADECGIPAETIRRLAGELAHAARSEEHTSELQSLMRISYAVFCLKKKNKHSSKKYIIQNLQ